MKHIIILLLVILIISCKKNNPNEFSLDVKVNGNYKGYLFINYNEKKDSSIISKGKAFFTGKVIYPTRAYYSTNNISANEQNFYIENEKIQSEITISKKLIKEYSIDWISINNISGTKTAIIVKDFEDFKKNNSADKDYKNKLYDKLRNIISQNPKHRYSGDLLSEISIDTILSKEQIGKLYYMLNVEFQDQDAIKRIRFKAFPENSIKVGDSIFDFELPNRESNLIGTNSFRGEILFIDYWASWCKPCRAQFPKLTKINNEFKEKGLKILGVSLDGKEDDWLKAMDIEKLQWANVIDTAGFSGKLANKYGISALPYNVLIDENGNVIANDISLEQLRKVVDSLINKKKTIANN